GAAAGASVAAAVETPAAPAAPAPEAMPEASAPAPQTTVDAPAAPAPVSAAPVAAPAGSGTARAPVFGSRDPDARAQRIARALVSDIVAYHPKRRATCLAAGTLRVEFRDEIMKSWEEYVAQVGLDMAKSTPHFRNALNAILASGQNIF
ncbi:MAG: hypothetical protein WD054_01275, partial [Gemmatimonadota bacterium]